MTLTYRGVKYDPEAGYKEYETWFHKIHDDVTRWLVYRNIKYRACSHA